MATGMQRRNTSTLACAMSFTLYGVAHFLPGFTMLLFRIAPSMKTPCSSIALYSVAWILVLMATAASRVWVPAMLTSGSTMGTRPTSWQMSA